MKRLLSAWILGCTVLFGSIAFASQDAKPSPTPAPAATQKPPVKTGEQVFNNNCMRCHQPPMGIPPRITGTVIMHMRTRARLSRQDEQLLLKYLAP